MTAVDLDALTDGDLEALRVRALDELERRRDVAQLPAQIERLTARYYRATKQETPVLVARPAAAVDCTTQDDITAAWAAKALAWVPTGVTVTVKQASPSACLTPPAGAYLGGAGTVRMAPAQSAGTRLINVAASGFTIEGVTLDLDRPNQPVNEQGHGIYVGAAGFTLRNVHAINCPGDGLILSQGTTNATVTALTTRACRRNGLTLYGWLRGVAVDGVTITGCDLEGGAQALDAEPEAGSEVRNVRVSGCHLRLPVRAPDKYAISLTGMIDSVVEWCHIEGSVYALGTGGFGPTRVTVRHCIIDGRESTRSTIRGYIHSQDVTFARCLIMAAPAQSAVDVGLSLGEWPTGWTIAGCEIIGSGDAPAVNIQGCPSIALTNTVIDARGGVAIRAWSTRETLVTGTGLTIRNAGTGVRAIPHLTNRLTLALDGTYEPAPAKPYVIDGDATLVTASGSLVRP